MQEDQILLDRVSPSSSMSTFASASSSDVSFPPNPLHTISNMRRQANKYFSILFIVNNLLCVGWLAVSIWVGVIFTNDFNYEPEFLLSFFPVFLVIVVGLLVENLPIMVILRSLRGDRLIPLPMIRVLQIIYL